MILPELQLFEIDVNCQDFSSLEDDFNLYSILQNHLKKNYFSKENINNKLNRNELESPQVSKKLKYDKNEADISDYDLIMSEIKYSVKKKY